MLLESSIHSANKVDTLKSSSLQKKLDPLISVRAYDGPYEYMILLLTSLMTCF